MIIIAQTKDGYIIEATEKEVRGILNSILGESSGDPVKIGQKIPAIDYASTITKVKTLKDTYAFKQITIFCLGIGNSGTFWVQGSGLSPIKGRVLTKKLRRNLNHGVLFGFLLPSHQVVLLD